MHNSPLKYHGFLNSSYCLIDERWQLKISYYGLKLLQKLNSNDKGSIAHSKDLLWCAPELLRLVNGKNSLDGSQKGDIYSFAIISSEILNMKSAWDEPNDENGLTIPERFHNHEEIIYLIKKGGLIPLRPIIRPAVADINPAMVSV